MSTTFVDLPLDVLLHVIDSFDTFDGRWSAGLAMRQVCMHTRSAMIEWASRVEEADLKTSVVPTCVAARKLTSLRRVSCGGYWSTVTDSSLESLARHCKRLTHVDVSRCPAISSEGAALLARSCPDLTYLDFTECYGIDTVVAVARACPKLEHVDLTWCYMIGDDSVVELGLRCPSLTYISTHACHRVNDVSVLGRCKSLTHVDVSGCMLSLGHAYDSIERGASDTDFALADADTSLASPDVTIDVLRVCRNLSYLNASGCGPTVDDAALEKIVESCTSLVHIRLAHCTMISDVGIRSLTRSCTLLTHIEVSSVYDLTDSSFVDLGAQCRHLRHVRAAHCEMVGDDGVSALARGCPMLTHLDMWECTRVSDVGVKVLASECSNVRYVCFRGSEVTQDGVLALLTGQSKAHLRHVDVHGATVSAAALASVRDGCPQLWHLDVSVMMDTRSRPPYYRFEPWRDRAIL